MQLGDNMGISQGPHIPGEKSNSVFQGLEKQQNFKKITFPSPPF